MGWFVIVVARWLLFGVCCLLCVDIGLFVVCCLLFICCLFRVVWSVALIVGGVLVVRGLCGLKLFFVCYS